MGGCGTAAAPGLQCAVIIFYLFYLCFALWNKINISSLVFQSEQSDTVEQPLLSLLFRPSLWDSTSFNQFLLHIHIYCTVYSCVLPCTVFYIHNVYCVHIILYILHLLPYIRLFYHASYFLYHASKILYNLCHSMTILNILCFFSTYFWCSKSRTFLLLVGYILIFDFFFIPPHTSRHRIYAWGQRYE